MKILLTGASGCLGTYLRRSKPSNVELLAVKFRRPFEHVPTIQLDLSKREDVMGAVKTHRPFLIIHTAYNQKEPECSIVQATRNVVDAAKCYDVDLIHLSSDLLLSGNEAPYDEAAIPSPIVGYGRAKAAVEAYIMEELPLSAIIRTSLIIGLDPINPNGGWVVESLKRGESINLFVDELRCPILAEDLAAMIWELTGLTAQQRQGIWNFVGPEAISRFAIGLLLARHFNLDASLIKPALNAALTEPRPRDLRMTSARSDRGLRYKPKPISTILQSQ